MTPDLALLGGNPELRAPLAPYRSIGPTEKRAAMQVLETGCLSGFYGSPGPEFYGGPNVRELEARWASEFKVAHAITVNSATSGLIAAMGAIGISPGDEIIVPPTTMSATVVAPMFYGGIPVFADIEDETFCLDPSAVAEQITDRTRAICAVNLFGHPAQLAQLRALADTCDLFLIEDSSQAPLAYEDGRRAGTVGHIGVFSLNYHKHIHTGEGGVCVTNDDELAERLALIRNHGENCVRDLGIDDITNLIGFNFRLTEFQAAIGLAQLHDIERHVGAREALAAAITDALGGFDGLVAPKVRPGCRHNHYLWTMRFEEARLGVCRATFSAALEAEGFPHFVGYIEPLYHLPMFQQRRAIGRAGFPFTLSERIYSGEMCPVAERLWRDEFVIFEPCAWLVDAGATEGLRRALRKVASGIDALRHWEAEKHAPRNREARA